MIYHVQVNVSSSSFRYKHKATLQNYNKVDLTAEYPAKQPTFLAAGYALCAMQKPVLTKGYYVNTLLMRSFSLIKTDFPVLTLFLKQTAGTLEKKPEHFRALTKSSHCGPKYLNHPTPP